MLKRFKASSKSLLLVSIIILSPLALSASFIEASSESASAALEDPSFEKQLVRINTGINLIRINTDIIQHMPVSEDSVWVDEVIKPINYRKLNSLRAVRDDPYYSTVMITNALLGKRVPIRMTPLEARLFWQAAVIYKNHSNDNSEYKIPDMNVFPDVTDFTTYISFNIKEDEKVALIDVEARSSNLHKNVEEAVISLLPEDMIENVTLVKDEYREALRAVGEQKAYISKLEVWLDDDANNGSLDRATKEQELEVAELALEEKQSVESEAEDRFFALLEAGVDAVKSNYDASKIPLAKKLDALLDAVDNNAIGASTMFAAATVGIVKGYGVIDQELQAIAKAQALTTLVANQREFIMTRYKRMLVGTLLATPNIGIGTYYAYAQSSSIGEYQDIVEAVLSAQGASE